MQQNTENINQILGIRNNENNPTCPVSKVSRLAWISLFLGIASPLSILLISGVASEILAVVPIILSFFAVLISLVAVIRIAFSRRQRKGILITFVGLLVGLGTGVFYLYIIAQAIMKAL